MSLSGGHNTEECASKQQNNCLAFLKVLSHPLDSCEEELESVIDCRLKEGVWKPNTCRTYLNNILKFVQYCKQNIKELYDNAALDSLSFKIRCLTASLSKIAKANRKSNLKQQSVSESGMINPTDFECYINSNRYESAKAIFMSKKPLNRETHVASRNFLLMMFVISNPHRTGALMNLKLEEFFKGESNVKNNQHIILVEKHKTKGVYGPAELVLDRETYKFAKTYRDLYRPAGESEHLFTTWNGRQLQSSGVVNALSTELAHAGVEKR